ncbi:hypothetical protein [Microseira wollei]|nr:hypothetical protein [Microseira wollei]
MMPRLWESGLLTVKLSRGDYVNNCNNDELNDCTVTERILA